MMKTIAIPFVFFLLLYQFAFAQIRKNLGQVINDPKRTEAYVAFSPDGKTMYFSRKSPQTHFDIYFSTQITPGNWSAPQPILELNNEKPNMVFYVYPDGNSLLIAGAYPEKGICKVTKTANGWSKPEYLKFEPKVTNWDQHNAKLSKDGKVMILSYQYDICVSFLQNNGSWTFPKKLPQTINTPYYEYTPFLAPDDRSLFFSSGGHGASENDIFVTQRLDETWMNWSTPVNVGNAVNSDNWESYFAFPFNGDMGYVYSLSEGYGDIFSFYIKDMNLGNPLTSLSGFVSDKETKKPLAATIEIVDKENLDHSYRLSSDKEGNYNIWLPFGKKYDVTLKADNYQTKDDVIDLTNISEFQLSKKDFWLQAIKNKNENDKIPVHEEKQDETQVKVVYFDFDKDTPKQNSAEELKEVVDYISTNNDINIDIEGHTDSIGSDIYNQNLSVRRAMSVFNFFKNAGIQESRMTTKGFGKSKPVADNRSDEGRAKNRRVEIILKKRKL